MTLPTSGPLAVSAINAEYAIGNGSPMSALRGKPGVPVSGPISFSSLYGQSNVAFTPDGGNVTTNDIGTSVATLSCNLPAVWTYTGSFQFPTNGTVSLVSGASGTVIQFTANARSVGGGVFQDNTGTFNVTSVSNGVTRNFTVSVTGAGNQ